MVQPISLSLVLCKYLFVCMKFFGQLEKGNEDNYCWLVISYTCSFIPCTQCQSPFVGDGLSCTLDSDNDGFPDQPLDSPSCADDPSLAYCTAVSVQFIGGLVICKYLTSHCYQCAISVTPFTYMLVYIF